MGKCRNGEPSSLFILEICRKALCVTFLKQTALSREDLLKLL
jgi:hypothetical protein